MRGTASPTDPLADLLSVCPGQYFAEDLVWLVIARILAVFQVEALHKDTEFQWTTGAVTQPVSFPAVIKPRSDDVRLLVES